MCGFLLMVSVLWFVSLSPPSPFPIQSPGAAAAAGTTVDTLPHLTAQMQQLQIAAATGYPSSHPAAAGQQQFHLPTHAQYHGNLPTAAGTQVTHPQWAIAQVSIYISLLKY